MAYIDNDEINKIRSQANITDIIASYNIELIKKGKDYKCICPFHDDHSPSMSVSPEKQIYKCFACGKTGNVFTFVSDYEDVPFIDAVAIVADKCGIDFKRTATKKVNTIYKKEYEIMSMAQKFFQNNLRTDAAKDALKYLNDRGIDDATIKEFGIGLSLDSNDSLLKLLTKKGYEVVVLDSLEKGHKGGEKLQSKAGRGLFVALLLFVGIPLPGTGAWTGTLAASLLDMDFKSSVIAVMLGVVLAGIIMGIVSMGVFGAIFAI